MSHTSMFVRDFFGQKQNSNHASTDPDLFKKVTAGDESWMHGYKIETKAQSSKWESFCYDWRDNRKIETGAVGDNKKGVFEVFRGLEKRWHNCIISERGYFEGDRIVTNK